MQSRPRAQVSSHLNFPRVRGVITHAKIISEIQWISSTLTANTDRPVNLAGHGVQILHFRRLIWLHSKNCRKICKRVEGRSVVFRTWEMSAR